MKALIPALLLAAWGSTTRADITPDYVAENYVFIGSAPCNDNESKEDGLCFIFLVDENEGYLVFTQNGEPIFIRHTQLGQPYETVWHIIEGTAL